MLKYNFWMVKPRDSNVEPICSHEHENSANPTKKCAAQLCDSFAKMHRQGGTLDAYPSEKDAQEEIERRLRVTICLVVRPSRKALA